MRVNAVNDDCKLSPDERQRCNCIWTLFFRWEGWSLWSRDSSTNSSSCTNIESSSRSSSWSPRSSSLSSVSQTYVRPLMSFSSDYEESLVWSLVSLSLCRVASTSSRCWTTLPPGHRFCLECWLRPSASPGSTVRSCMCGEADVALGADGLSDGCAPGPLALVRLPELGYQPRNALHTNTYQSDIRF